MYLVENKSIQRMTVKKIKRTVHDKNFLVKHHFKISQTVDLVVIFAKELGTRNDATSARITGRICVLNINLRFVRTANFEFI